MKPATLALLVTQLLSPLALSAQPLYRLGPDTLRYREQTQGRLGLQMGDSLAVLETEADAMIAVVLQPSARAWYESLRLRQAGPGAQRKAPADAVIGQAFSFSFNPSGRVSVQQSPAVPQEIFVVFDITHQFDDFFITLPTQRLTVGVTWVDTLIVTRAAYPTHRYRVQGTRRYRVERDTTVDSRPAVLINVQGVATIDYSAPGGAAGETITGRMEGEESGYAVVMADGTLLIGRQREGWTQGSMTLRAGGRTVTVPTRSEYRDALSLQRR